MLLLFSCFLAFKIDLLSNGPVWSCHSLTRRKWARQRPLMVLEICCVWGFLKLPQKQYNKSCVTRKTARLLLILSTSQYCRSWNLSYCIVTTISGTDLGPSVILLCQALLLITVPECDPLHYKGVVVNASGWETDPQHILGRWDVIRGWDAV